MIDILTLTGARPLQLQRAKYYLQRQTRQDFNWIVIDDGIIPFDPGNCTYIGRKPDGKNSIQRQFLFSLPYCTGDYIFIWEDDDWYSPKRIEQQLEALKEVDIHGYGQTTYYHVGVGGYRKFTNDKHSAFFEMAFTRKGFDSVVDLIKKEKRPFLDLAIWRKFRNPSIKMRVDNTQNLCLGMKGLPGRPGLAGHNKGNYTKDIDYKFLRETIKEDAQWYIDLGTKR